MNNINIKNRIDSFISILRDKLQILTNFLAAKLSLAKSYSKRLIPGIVNFLVFAAIALFLLMIPKIINGIVIKSIQLTQDNSQSSPEDILPITKSLEREIENLNRQLINKTPRSFYLVINSTTNEFSLYKGKNIIKTDKCSTGSYILLKKGEEQEWMFKTPKGEFRILGKTTSPVWKKPDWAFIEEGLPVPSYSHFSRYEYGVLGDYALSLGDGYLIHGTLYQRFLGLPVTHGCIRLNDENLKLVYNSLSIGSKVYIF